jgi:HlyD family secretion protein
VRGCETAGNAPTPWATTSNGENGPTASCTARQISFVRSAAGALWVTDRLDNHVIRVDPAVEQGTVSVDVALDGALPKGARPDLSVDGTIELERLDNVLYVGRPAFAQDGATVGVFKLTSGGEATRNPVHFGRSSVNTIEILEGLKEGDQVILSDTSAYDSHDRISLN